MYKVCVILCWVQEFLASFTTKRITGQLADSPELTKEDRCLQGSQRGADTNGEADVPFRRPSLVARLLRRGSNGANDGLPVTAHEAALDRSRSTS